ncbi:PD-(D/E)XK nuclease family transposase [Candidatus Cardinium hertigii]|uniref:PD-(D/E)XK nuclease family transposase n=1 Tax=Candidatus Cardinium hertigii TaxID=247481 RepID=UPI003D7CD70E
MDKPVQEKKDLDKGLKRSAGKFACCVSKGEGDSNITLLPNQVAPQEGFEKRAQYYASKAYCRQLNAGQEVGARYQDLKGVIFIAITDYIVFPEKKDYLSNHVILDSKTYARDLKDFSFTFIELPKFKIKSIGVTLDIGNYCTLRFFLYCSMLADLRDLNLPDVVLRFLGQI